MQDEDVRNRAKELKAHIMKMAVYIRQYLEDILMVAVILQALQHLIVERPLDPFRWLAKFIREEGPLIADEIERCRKIAAARQTAHDKAKSDAEEADRLACVAAEATAKALRDLEDAKLAAAARAAAEEGEKARMLKSQQASKVAAVATDPVETPISKVGKKKELTKPAKPVMKPEWQK